MSHNAQNTKKKLDDQEEKERKKLSNPLDRWVSFLVVAKRLNNKIYERERVGLKRGELNL